MRTPPCIGILFLLFQLIECQSLFDLLVAMGIAETRTAGRGFGMFDTTGVMNHGPVGIFGDRYSSFGPTVPDPSLQDARMSAAEEQMAEILSETPSNNPEHQRISRLIQQSGGRFAGDAAPLNHLVEEYLMTTPGPEPPSSTSLSNSTASTRPDKSTRAQTSRSSGPRKQKSKPKPVSPTKTVNRVSVPVNENMKSTPGPVIENKEHVIYQETGGHSQSQNHRHISDPPLVPALNLAKGIEMGNARQLNAVEKLRNIDSRIDTLNGEVRHAQKTGNASQNQQLQSALASINKVRDILMGTLNRPSSRQTASSSFVSQEHNGRSNSNGRRQNQNNRIHEPSGSSVNGNLGSSGNGNGRSNRSTVRANNRTPTAGSSSFQETNIVGTRAQSWNTQPQAINTRAAVGPNPESHVNTGQSANTNSGQGTSLEAHVQTSDRPINYETTIQYNKKQQSIAVSLSSTISDAGTAQTVPTIANDILPAEQLNLRNESSTAAPVEGDVRIVGNETYIYTDADGFDTFQWIKAEPTTGPVPESGTQQQA